MSSGWKQGVKNYQNISNGMGVLLSKRDILCINSYIAFSILNDIYRHL